MKSRFGKTKILTLFLLVSVSACTPVASPPTSIPTSTKTPLPAFTITPSLTPTKTPTPTNTFTPSPTPIGGALISFTQLDLRLYNFFCGLMDANGQIISRNSFNYFEGDQDARYCPRQAVTRYGSDPIGSPDNQKYLYVVGRDRGKELIYYVGDTSTGRSKLLADLISYVNLESGYPLTPELVWLADNRHLVFFDRNSDDLILLDSQDGTIETLGSFPTPLPSSWVRGIVPSHIEPLILFSAGETSSDLHLLNTITGEDKNLTAEVDSVWICCIKWSSDGSRFSFFINEKKPQSSQIVSEQRIMNRDGNLIAILENSGQATWSPSGDQFLFECNIVENTSELCLSNANSDEIVKIEHSRFKNAGDFTWSPDGEKLAYYTNILKNNGTQQLTVHVLSLKTGEEKDIISFPKWTVVFPIQWSPDSQWLLLLGAGPPESENSDLGTALLCDLNAICNDFNEAEIIIRSAEWWRIPPNWEP